MNSRLMPAGTVKNAKGRVVGLLDIFGFEDRPINGVKQRFIKLANKA